MKKRFLLILTCIFVVCCTGLSLAATRADLAAIHVSKAGNFQYWAEGSPAKQALMNYVKAVTNEKSPDFIPVEDRIAVFDVDGTLMCETAPTYFDQLMYFHRMYKDSSWKPSADLLAAAQVVQDGAKSGKSELERELIFGNSRAKAFAGMSRADFTKYIQNFMEEPAEGLTNLKRGEAFYLPMVEVVSYLKANDFTVYIVSGCDRESLRALADGILPISPGRIIGTDTNYVASHQNGESGITYQYRKDDELVRGEYLVTNVKMNKVSSMAKEIGQQPVLAFGNSTGDFSMFQYTTMHNKYKSAAFTLLCDDMDREFGNQKKADAMVKSAAENGWVTVSMKKDFKTIYGDTVKKVKPLKKAS